MTCGEARPLVNAYVDGELDVVECLELETHLNGCAACAREEANLRALHTALRNNAPYYEAPAPLEPQVRRAALRDAQRTESGERMGFFAWTL